MQPAPFLTLSFHAFTLTGFVLLSPHETLHIRLSPPTSPSATQTSPPAASFTPLLRRASWSPWSPHTALSLRPSPLEICVVALRPAPRQRLRLRRRPPRERVVGRTRVALHTLATGPVDHALQLTPGPAHGVQSPLCLAFRATVQEEVDVRIALAGVSVSLDTPAEKPYVVAEFVKEVRPEVVGTGGGGGAFGVVGRGAVVVVSSRCLVSTVNPTWESVPVMRVGRASLAELAHGSLVLRLHEGGRGNTLIASRRIAFHQLWGIERFTTDLRIEGSGACRSAAVSFSLWVDGCPRTGQMLQGVHTDFGIFGARPVLFGAPVPKISGPISSGIVSGHSVFDQQNGAELPSGWHEIIDSFGWVYWHDTEGGGRDSWVKPDANGRVSDPDHVLADDWNVDRVGNTCFRRITDGAESWIHPLAWHISALPVGGGGRLEKLPPNPPTRRTLHKIPPIPAKPGHVGGNHHVPRLDASDRDGARRRRRRGDTSTGNLPSTRASLLREVKASHDHWRRPPTDDHHSPQHFPHLALDTDPPTCAFHMMWQRNDAVDGGPPIPGTEGHSLTRHADGSVVRFGGAASDGRKLSSIFSLSTQTLQWMERPAVGALPEGRVGHGAISLGDPQDSRLLVFGGTSRVGRLNDMYCFHLQRNAWSPVATTGPRPSPRARLGMASAHFSDEALCFGGRSGYSYIGDRYFGHEDSFLFNANRSEWFNIKSASRPGPTPRSGCVVEALNDRLYLIHGGFDERQYFGDTWLFDSVSCTWQLPPYADEQLQPSAREMHASTAVGSCVLVYGGEGEGAYSSDLHLFDGDKLRWCAPPVSTGHSPGARSGAAMVALDNRRVVLLGGSTGFASVSDSFVLDTQVCSMTKLHSLREMSRQRRPSSDSCVICLEERPTELLIPCDHVCMCRRCSKRSISKCPICREEIFMSITLQSDL